MEQIVADVANDLYARWSAALPEDEKNEVAFKALATNAQQTTIFVIQNFMDRFNKAADKLKNE